MSVRIYEFMKLKKDFEKLQNKYEILLTTQVEIIGRLKDLEDTK